MKVLITGATGLIGKALVKNLLAKGHEVSFYSRSKEANLPGATLYTWDPEHNQLDERPLLQADAIVNLAGAGVADQRWTGRYKKKILDSRIQATRLLVDTLAKSKYQANVLVNASAIGYYGFDTGDQWIRETDPPGEDFLAQVVQKWENEAFKAEKLGIRTVALRIGIVLAAEGGALPKLALPIKWGVGAPFGSGNQYISWISVEDLAEMFSYAVENAQLQGAYNAVAPQPVTNKELTTTLAKFFNRPLLMPHVPGFVLRLLVGEMADTLLGGNLISADKIASTGFAFRDANITDAIQHQYRR